jgi:branched-chain amino acid transport system permease protein
MPDLKPFLATGLALGGIYALSGASLVLLYRTTAVVNFAYGGLGAAAALVTWQVLDKGGPEPLAWTAGVAVATAASLAYGTLIHPRLASRDIAISASGSLGAALILLGACTLIWGDQVRTLNLGTSQLSFRVTTAYVNGTQVFALALATGVVIAAGAFLRWTLLGTTIRALANDRGLSALLGIRVRRVEALTWGTVGALAGLCGILFGDLVSLQPETLTFMVIASLAAAVVGSFRSLWMAYVGGIVIGLLQACSTPFQSLSPYSDAVPFLVAIVALLIRDVRRHSRGERVP